MHWQQVNSAHRATSPTTRGTNRSMCKLTNTSTTDSWALWIEPQLSLFVFSLSSLLLVSASLDCFSLFRWSHTALVQVRIHPMLHAHVSSLSVASDLSDASIQLLLLPHHLSDHPVLPTARQLQLPRCGGHTLRTSAEDLGTLAEYDPLTSYEPNDHFITEVYVEYTQESTGEQRFPDDFDNDDVTIGKTLLDARRRRADHSEEEGLSSCLSSSVRRDRTERPVVCSLGSQVSSGQETQRLTSRVTD